MRRHVKAWVRPLAAVLALLTGFALTAPPAAAETALASMPAASSAPLSAAVARAAATAPATALVQAANPSPAESESPGGFFSTPKGKIAVALFVGGVAWTIYSVSDSRKPVKSPIR